MLTRDFCQKFDTYVENGDQEALYKLITSETTQKDHNEIPYTSTPELIAKYANSEMINRLINKPEYSDAINKILTNLIENLEKFGRSETFIKEIQKKLTNHFLRELRLNEIPQSSPGPNTARRDSNVSAYRQSLARRDGTGR